MLQATLSTPIENKRQRRTGARSPGSKSPSSTNRRISDVTSYISRSAQAQSPTLKARRHSHDPGERKSPVYSSLDERGPRPRSGRFGLERPDSRGNGIFTERVPRPPSGRYRLERTDSRGIRVVTPDQTADRSPRHSPLERRVSSKRLERQNSDVSKKYKPEHKVSSSNRSRRISHYRYVTGSLSPQSPQSTLMRHAYSRHVWGLVRYMRIMYFVSYKCILAKLGIVRYRYPVALLSATFGN
ncbi:unnamed protein product [Owenia fusiformis]|uniref:Uncharacterized protein n=1 Tax=Owenia fusiformis TaxID=6347 RepID=A0A8J1TBY2_OWEFU|nr:unnamed protein product [Owenia fusiformis]